MKINRYKKIFFKLIVTFITLSICVLPCLSKIVDCKLDEEDISIIINFAGNLGDLGGPYWRPPGEKTHLNGIFENGYYTNDSRQQENWIYINLTVISNNEIDHVWLQWLNCTKWTNWTYEFMYSGGNFWELNTSNIIQTTEGCDYSFDVVVNDSLGNSKDVRWEKTGLGGGLTRRYVQLGCIPEDITYKPFYLRNHTSKTGKYFDSDRKTHDRLHHDQGPDGTIIDSGYLNSTLPTNDLEELTCYSYTGYWFEDSVCAESFNLTNVYFHVWYACYDDFLSHVGWCKSKKTLSTGSSLIDYYDPINSHVNRTSIHQKSELTSHNHACLEANVLHTTPTSFTDNDIYEFYVLFQQELIRGPFDKDVDSDSKVGRGDGRIITLSNRKLVSFIVLNIPDNATLSGIDTDNDGLNDFDELFVHITSPFLADTDSDGFDDFTEVNGRRLGFIFNGDPNVYSHTPYGGSGTQLLTHFVKSGHMVEGVPTVRFR